jgi:YD repeat-containing protein
VTVTITHHDGPATRELADVIIVPLYEAAYADHLTVPFYSVPRFLDRLTRYTTAPGFALALARDDAGHPVGQAFGYPLPSGARWWNGLLTQVEEGFTTENRERTFALNEIMVHPDVRRQGIAQALHDALLRNRSESRATLLVRADNAPARIAYARWGWYPAAKLQPFPDSPVYDALILDLPLP